MGEQLRVEEVSAGYLVTENEAEVPAGYKKTELGIIPEDWDVKPVSEAFEICNYLRFPLSNKVRSTMPGSYPYYGPTKIQDYINEYRVEGEYALIGEDGDHFLKFDTMPQTQLATGRFNVNNHAHLVKGMVGSAKWFFFYFRNRDISFFLTRQGAGRFKLNKASLEKIPCALPPAPEQTAIAATLSDVDALIEGLDQLTTKKRNLKQATMQQLLTGKTRLPEFALREDGTPKGYKQSELGEIPEDWDVRQLRSMLIEPPRYGINAPAVPLKGDLPVYIRITDISEEGYFRPSERVGVDSSSSSFYLLNEGAIVVARTGASVGKSYLYRKEDGELVYAGFLIKIACDVKQLLPGFLFQYMKSDKYWSWVALNSMRSGQPGINGNEYGSLLIPAPDVEEQCLIAEVLLGIDEEILALEKRLTKTQLLKQGMMQELLTGKTRLIKPELTHGQ